ncbi:hypothetical protein FF38_12034 [Lucilia cuprina]|uniref:Uncharacterized protein n=1 Tax=Lucilia cuprina TaxID=7375 RepID=A0A0L0BLS8_LUCCU|nr:hypothetical protein FF38_12034 [Lucilia cuprina]
MTFVCKTCSTSATFMVDNCPSFMQPALFTSISTPPKWETILSNASFTDFKLETSHFSAVSLVCKFLGNSFLISSTRSTRLAKPTTCKPFLRRSLTMATPIPELAPVTTAILFCQRSRNTIRKAMATPNHSTDLGKDKEKNVPYELHVLATLNTGYL